MSRILYENEDFKILQAKDYVVVRKGDYPYDFHSHFKRYSGAEKLLRLFKKKLKPHDKYFNMALKRITTEAEWDSYTDEKSSKPMYYNSSKGVRRAKTGRGVR